MTRPIAKLNKGGRPHKFTEEMIADALRACAGIISNTARVLGCDRKTVERAIAGSKTLKEAKDDADKVIVDMALAVVVRALQKNDAGMARFVLMTRAKSEGWTTRPASNGEGNVITIVMDEWTSRL